MTVKVVESAVHPKSLADVLFPTIVRSSPSIELTAPLCELVRSNPNAIRKVPEHFSTNFRELQQAYSEFLTVNLSSGNDSFCISNTPIPSDWIGVYRLCGDPRQKFFMGLVQFGEGHTTGYHIEECAAATYGCLLEGEKEWFFRLKDGSTISCKQNKGDTVYVPPGFYHRVITLSNGAILVGETTILPTSIDAFASNISPLYNGIDGTRHNVEKEADRLCKEFDIVLSKTELHKGGTWYGPATRTILARHPRSSGGSKSRDKAGKKRRKAVFTAKKKKRRTAGG
ncbi:hypothetical protein F443_22216 [Phytophthora nicotianae P1569]|uniref:JmjC domain-containing protein n=1 Tax=Phytophthora nicotianae P1569 TaxID=1317065 RepID=V9DVL4_PHYNI|nr:hypothetical protein F443_22216 [Phytophthora nicotianae P1569]